MGHHLAGDFVALWKMDGGKLGNWTCREPASGKL